MEGINSGTNDEAMVKILTASQGKRQTVMGDLQTIKLTGKDTNGAFTLIEQDNLPGTVIPMHVHGNEDELFRILEGEIEFFVGGSTRVLGAGDTIYLPREVPHGFIVVGNCKAKVIVTIFPSGIEEMFEQLSELPAGIPDLLRVSEICGNFGIRFV